MSNDRYCRFRVVAHVDGETQLNGFFTLASAEIALNSILRALSAPTVSLAPAFYYLEGALMTVTALYGETLVGYEIEVIANPDGMRKSEEPLEPLPPQK